MGRDAKFVAVLGAAQALALGCGGASRATAADVDASTSSEAAVAALSEASPPGANVTPGDGAAPPPQPVSCDGGYFFELDDDGGVRLLTFGCGDAGPNVPILTGVRSYAEDCPTQVLTACGDSASLLLSTGCGVCGPATCDMNATFVAGDGGRFFGPGEIQISPVPLDGGPVEGTYAGTFVMDVDGGTSAHAVTGRFCVLFVR